LNQPNLAKLQAELTAALDANWAAFVVAYRQFGPTTAGAAGQAGPPPVTPTLPPLFQIRSVLDLVGASVTVPGLTPQNPPQTFASPLGSEPQALGEQLVRLLDRTTTISLPVVRGGVSVNHAPASVLACVPGLDDTLASRIEQARSGESATDDGSRRFATWILTEGLVDLPTMKKLLPNLSGGGDVYRAHVVAYFEDKGSMASAEVVIDATATPARQIFFRDRRFFGAGVTREQLTDGGSAPRGR